MKYVLLKPLQAIENETKTIILRLRKYDNRHTQFTDDSREEKNVQFDSSSMLGIRFA